MKLKTLASVAKEDRNLTILDEIDSEGLVTRQYVMLPERAIFPLDGLPILKEEQLLTMMDVPREKHDEWIVVRHNITSELQQVVDDAKLTDREAKLGWTGIAMNGVAVRPVFGGEKVRFVESDLLKVVADERGVELKERRTEYGTVYVMLVGMCNIGCLIPTVAHWSEKCASELAEVGEEARRVWERMQEEAEADGSGEGAGR